MEAIKTYSYLEKKEKVFGLEVIDFLVLAVTYALVFLFSSNLILNIGILAFIYFGLRLYKKGKPPMYTKQLIRFLVTPKYFTLPGKEQTQEF